LAATEVGGRVAATPELSASLSEFARRFKAETVKEVQDCASAVGNEFALLKDGMSTKSISELRAGRGAMVQGDVEQAQRWFCMAVAHDPYNYEAHVSLIRLFLTRGSPPRAKQAVDHARKYFPETRFLTELLGDTLACLGDVALARSAWLEAAGVDAEDEGKVRHLAATFTQSGRKSSKGMDFARALGLFRRGVVLDPENTAAQIGLSEALLAVEDAQAAKLWAMPLVERFPEDSNLHLILGDVHDKLGDAEAARLHWGQAATLNPGNIRARRRARAAGLLLE
jgi:tetratricopeptide (TPR) repeat protein